MRDDERDRFCEYAAARMPALLRLAFLLVHDEQLAQDVVQNALVKLYLSWSRVERADDHEAYVRRVVVNAAIDHGRRRRSHPVADWADRPSPSDAMAAVETTLDIRRYLDSLPAKQRAVVVLRYYADLSEQQTADLLGISTGTVESHASRALAALRRELAAAPLPEVTPCP